MLLILSSTSQLDFKPSLLRYSLPLLASSFNLVVFHCLLFIFFSDFHLHFDNNIMKKVVLKVDINDDKIKQKAMKAVSGLSGVESVSVDMKDKKLTLTGDVDPINIVSKLRKLCHTDIVSVGPAKEEKKEDANKKDDKKKPDDKKDSTKDIMIDPLKFYPTYAYHYQMKPPQYNDYYDAPYRTVDEDPNGCVII